MTWAVRSPLDEGYRLGNFTAEALEAAHALRHSTTGNAWVRGIDGREYLVSYVLELARTGTVLPPG